MHDKLKKIIFDKLYKDLSKVEIINYNNTIWFIDREDKYWYFEYETSGNLYWRYDFFIDFFSLFSLEMEEFEPIMSEWVEEVLNCKINTIPEPQRFSSVDVEEVLNYKVNTTSYPSIYNCWLVEEVLNCKVNTTTPTIIPPFSMVEQVLDCKVKTTDFHEVIGNKLVEKILNYKVDTTQFWLDRPNEHVEDALNLIPQP